MLKRAVMLCCLTATPVHAEFKANVLPKAEEAKWVTAVKALKTADGSTVGETLAFVARMRPREFKVKEISPGYGQDGNAHGMNVCYWVGQKRLDGDEYCASTGGRGSAGADFDYDIFADLFRGRGGEGANFRMPPQDVRYTLEVDFFDAVRGGHKVVSMPDGRTLNITIPAGINEGQVLRLKSQGSAGSDGKTGDAYVQISVRPHPGFRREGNDVLTTLPVSLGEALNGASVRVDTVDGPVDVKVPKGAREGTKLRLRGKGVAYGKDGARGDQLVEIHIVPPDGADDALAQFMVEWEKTHPQNPRRKGAA